MRKKTGFVLMAIVLAGAAGASTVIYQENFDGPADTLLNGRAPSIAPAGVTWVAGDDFKADGSVVWDGVPFGGSAYLPFSPQDGYIYELTAYVDMTQSDTGNDWIAMGFTELNTVPNSRFFNDNGERNPRYWMLSRVAGATLNDQTFVGPGTGGGQEAPTRSANDLKIVLNTTAATWTVSWYFDGSLARTVEVAEGDKGLLNYVALSTNRTTGTISSFKLAGIPCVAWNPSPVDGATGLLPDVVFSWNKARDPMSPDEPNALILEHRLSYSAYPLDYAPDEPNVVGPGSVQVIVADSDEPVRYPADGAVYIGTDQHVFWRVDHILSSGKEVIGNVWQFSTLRSVPLITQEPVITEADPGTEAVFTVAFESYSPAAVVWMKAVDGTEDLPLNDEAGIVADPDKYAVSLEADQIQYTSTLIIKDVSPEDQSRYYCIISNSSSEIAESRKVSLAVKHLLAHYAFENNFEDWMGGPSGTPMSNDPNYPTLGFVEGIAGEAAVSLRAAPTDNTRGQSIDLSREAFPKAGPGNGLETGTISMWIKPTRTLMPMTLMSNFNENIRENPEDAGIGTTGFSFSMSSTSQIRMVVRGEPIDGAYYEMGTVQGGTESLMDEWHHVVTTWKAGSHIDLYIDGVAVASIAAGTPQEFLDWQYGVLLGAGRSTADRQVLSSFYGGAIDDVRVYNYAKDKYGVAELYYEVSGNRPCIDEFASEFDFNTDCVVDLADFAEFARHWLDSGLYPNP